MKTLSQFIKFPALVLIALFLSIEVVFAGVAGQVQFTNGNVQITTLAGVTRPLFKGDVINEGDVVTTALASSAQIKMRDGGFVAVRPDTRMKFDQFVFNGKQDGQERSFFSLFKGGFRAVTGFVGMLNKQNYKINTPAATIGIRGTDHETYVVPEGNALIAAGAYSKVNVGETTLTTNQGTVNVQPNQMGYASGMNAAPKLAPINTNIFTVAVSPTKTIKESKEEKQEQKSEKQGGDKPTSKETKSEQTEQAKSSKPENKAETSPAASPEKKQEVAATPQGSGTASSQPSTPETTTAGDATVLRNVTADVKPLSSMTSTQVVAPIATTAIMPIVTVAAPTQVLPIKLVDASGNTFNTSAQTVTTATGSTAPVSTVVTNLASGGTLANAVNPVVITPPVVATDFAYAFDHVAGQSVWGNRSWGWLAALSDLSYVAGSAAASGQLLSFIERSIGGGTGSVNTTTVTGGTATSANAPSFASTGIQYGEWSGYTSQATVNTSLLGGTGGGGASAWMYGPVAYWDSQYWNGTTFTTPGLSTIAVGSFTYHLDGGSSPEARNTGLKGNLTSAIITASFGSVGTSLIASLGLTMPGNEMWTATTGTLTSSSSSILSFYASSSAGNLTVMRGVGAATTCIGCGGNLSIGFTGQNFAGAIIAYALYNSTLLGSTDVQGNAALTRNYTANTNPTVINGAANPPTPASIVVAQNNGSQLNSYSTWTNPGNVLTSYGSGGNSVSVSCPTCTATASSQVATSGIYYGNWTSGSYSNTNTQTGNAGSKSYWITGPEAGPLYLSQALTGSASYVFDAGLVTNGSGVSGTVLGTSTLSLDFTRQLVGINLNLSVPDTINATVHAWNATAQAFLQGNQGIGGTGFRASTFGGGGNALLTVTVDGRPAVATSVSEVNGQLTGAGLTGAIMSFNLSGLSTESVQGVAAFSGAAQGTALSHRYVSISYFDELGVIPVLGFYANNAARVTQDASGNLTKFDTQGVSNGGSASTTIANVNATPLDLGTDPVTGVSWGRWAGGSITDTDRITGTVKTKTQLGSLHWIAESATSSAVTLPISGTYTYIKAGGTSPTDQQGTVGVLNSATLTANFTAQTVNMGVNVSVGGATLNAVAANAPIIQKTVFYASSQEPSASSSYLNVTCTGTCNGTAGGTVIGKFTGTGATGAVMTYGLQNGPATVAATNNPVISGVVAFHR
ncbi:MAG: FecR domain-containing protein [Gallionellaceae bacterium]